MTEDSNWEVAVANWHRAVNSGDPEWAAEVVTDPVEVDGPHGAAVLSPREFAGWVRRSRIALEPHAWHPVTDSITVVQQRATWPDGTGRTEPAEVATLFVTSGFRIAAALRFDDLATATRAAHERAARTQP